MRCGQLSMIAGAMGRVRDVGERLRREDHRHILFAQHFEPFADARCEQRMIEKHPGLVEDEQA
jgi:hypothetical protein